MTMIFLWVIILKEYKILHKLSWLQPALEKNDSPFVHEIFDDNGFLIPSKIPEKEVTRRQDAPIVYDVDGIFIVDAKNFLKTEKIYSGKILPYEISKEHGYMIDFEFDFKVAELLLANN